ncbi:MAG TPA: hypothetical protein VIL86_18665, partial [Tepidisphaeraceae bacterium]
MEGRKEKSEVRSRRPEAALSAATKSCRPPVARSADGQRCGGNRKPATLNRLLRSYAAINPLMVALAGPLSPLRLNHMARM